MAQLNKKNLLEKLLERLKNTKTTKNTRDFAKNGAILNTQPKNHKSSKAKVVQK